MAARRLVVAMLVMLALSTLAAALVPRAAPKPGKQNTVPARGATPRRPALPPPAPAAGRLRRSTLAADARRPTTVTVARGDQLLLRVAAATADQVEIEGLGQVQPVQPGTPALFDLLADRPGLFAVRLVDSGRRVGSIRVRPAG